MTDAEVGAYMAGIDLGRNATVLSMRGGQVEMPEDAVIDPAVLERCRGLRPEEFRYWLLRGVGDAFKE